MTIDAPLEPAENPEDAAPPPTDLTVDLTLDGMDEVDDLQALADEAADELKVQPHKKQVEEPQPPVREPKPEDEITDYLNAELESTLQEALKRIKEMEKHEAEYLDRHHRLLADFSNYRNRTAKEIQMAVDLSEKKMLREILPVLDSFERCLGASYQSLEDFRAGVELIQKQFVDALRKIGVEAVPLEVGDPFDALHSEALTTTKDPVLDDGAVAAIFERGFMLRDQLLRPARVVVNRVEGLEGN